MMEHYDFILFENYRNASHHKFDLIQTASFLKYSGMKVAILDVFREYSVSEIEGIRVIHHNVKLKVPVVRWTSNKFVNLFKKLSFLCLQHRFMKAIVIEITPLADQFYFGSYYELVSSVLISMKKPSYFWGLRSIRFKYPTFKDILKEPVAGIHKWYINRMFKANPYQRLFVSNQIIFYEHVALGIPQERMIIREERVVKEKTTPLLEKLTSNVSFLTIGLLRKEKNIDKTIDAFKLANIEDAKLYLAGRSAKGYETIIEKAIGKATNIVRINAFLEYEDFFKYFIQSHFVLFADSQGSCCITNGTMMEALIHHRPIICPDYAPYKYYIEKYHIGLLYDPTNLESYSNTLKLAASMGTTSFQQSIDKFLETIMFDKVSRELVGKILL